MITAVDTSVLLKILKHEADADLALMALENAANQGSVLVCAIVIAELGRFCMSNEQLNAFLNDAQLTPSSVDQDAALAAANIMRSYAKNKGEQVRIAADFLIGAHAMTQADQLLTSDAGFMRQYFKTLQVIHP